jgi:hypothetical protein
MEEKHPLNRTKEVSVDVVSSVDANKQGKYLEMVTLTESVLI